VAVLSSGFTPSTRDVDALCGLLGDDDEKVVRAVEHAIARAGAGEGPVWVARLLSRADASSPAVRARLFRAVGRLAPKDAASAGALASALRDPDGRVQKAAANALGRLRESEASAQIAAALLDAWDRSPALPLARALAEAMGKLGLVQARGRLEAVPAGDAELSRIAGNAVAMLRRDGSRGDRSEIDAGRSGDFDVDLVLLCRAGLEDLVREELTLRCPSVRSVGGRDAAQVTATWRGAPQDLFAVRTMLGFAFALPSEPAPDDAATASACVRALSSEAARRIVETWTLGTVRYRIDWQGKGHSRAMTWQVVHALEERCPGWVNDPTSSTWQASVSVAEGRLRVLLVPRGLVDPRFVYRVRDVPAASHPTLAAALVRASRISDADVVWDPFVGSGTELVERARAGAYRTLIGSDLDLDAIGVARGNAAAAGVAGVIFQIADATLHAPCGVTRIVTNPPMGRRVARDGSLVDLIDRFTDNAARVLSRGGRLTWLSPLGGRTAARAEACGLRVALRKPVDMGGFFAELQAWDKP
jgi:23S rRNA G2445 N2-methylase RlmL